MKKISNSNVKFNLGCWFKVSRWSVVTVHEETKPLKWNIYKELPEKSSFIFTPPPDMGMGRLQSLGPKNADSGLILLIIGLFFAIFCLLSSSMMMFDKSTFSKISLMVNPCQAPMLEPGVSGAPTGISTWGPIWLIVFVYWKKMNFLYQYRQM